ncbi:MAG: NHLP-related RiPP peptide [Candidatus Polarisedimenticolia bacterium]
MSQKHVERIIGRLVTDEEFRDRFAADPEGALRALGECGMELTPLEVRVLASIDPQVAARFAEAIDMRLQKACMRRRGGES